MYRPVPSRQFRKQVKKLAKTNPKLLKKLELVINSLCLSKVLPAMHQDHKLSGRLQDFCECHIAPNWLLIYRQHKDILILELVATGSHTTLFD